MRVTQRLFPRLLLTVLAAFIPFAVAMTFIVTRESGHGITRAARQAVSTSSTALANRVEEHLRNRIRDVQQVAGGLAATRADAAGTRGALVNLDRVRETYDVVVLLRADGSTVASSRPGTTIAARGSEWLATAAGGEATVGRPVRHGQRIVLPVAAPIPGRRDLIVAADFDVTKLWSFARFARVGTRGDVLLIDSDQRKLLALSDGRPRSEADLLARNVLRERIDTAAARGAAAGRTGTIDRTRVNGREYISGFAPIPLAGWGIIVRDDREIALADLGQIRNLALVVVLFGILLASVLAYLFARQAASPLTRIAGAAREVAAGNLRARVAQEDGAAEVRELSGSFNQMVEALSGLVVRIEETTSELAGASTELSAAAEELAASTQEQTTAATETSATMEELARTFTSIADTIDGVARQTADTRSALERAETGMETSSQRTLALSERVGEIGGILALINEIADQTNLLALNAAIEAARAGDAGRGFTVVADEVRRLAESSKSQAAEIATIIEGTQDETNATVMAMEASSKQMRSGLEQMDAVAEATEQVRLTTQQQTAAAQQVAETMEAVTQTSRQTSTTAQQIAAAANQLNELVTHLRTAAAQVEADRRRR